MVDGSFCWTEAFSWRTHVVMLLSCRRAVSGWGLAWGHAGDLHAAKGFEEGAPILDAGDEGLFGALRHARYHSSEPGALATLRPRLRPNGALLLTACQLLLGDRRWRATGFDVIACSRSQNIRQACRCHKDSALHKPGKPADCLWLKASINCTRTHFCAQQPGGRSWRFGLGSALLHNVT